MNKQTLAALMQVSIKDIQKHLVKVFSAGLVPYLKSAPGVGKSSNYRQFAKDYNLKYIDIRISSHLPEDFNGYLVPNKSEKIAEFIPIDLLPFENEPLPINDEGEEYEGYLICLDEFSHGDLDILKSMQRLILDRMAGQYKLHPKALLALAGNRPEDNALAGTVGTAINSRVTHIELTSDVDFYIHKIIPMLNMDYRIAGYLSYNNTHLNDFDPMNEDHSFCCERTWSAVSKIIEGEKDLNQWLPLIAGTISPGVASDFVNFCNIFKTLISVDDIVKNPMGIQIPTDAQSTWALVTYLTRKVTDDNFLDLFDFISRLSMQYQIMFMRFIPDKYAEYDDPRVVAFISRLSGFDSGN